MTFELLVLLDFACSCIKNEGIWKLDILTDFFLLQYNAPTQKVLIR